VQLTLGGVVIDALFLDKKLSNDGSVPHFLLNHYEKCTWIVFDSELTLSITSSDTIQIDITSLKNRSSFDKTLHKIVKCSVSATRQYINDNILSLTNKIDSHVTVHLGNQPMTNLSALSIIRPILSLDLSKQVRLLYMKHKICKLVSPATTIPCLVCFKISNPSICLKHVSLISQVSYVS
jgi:hypothetical protein